MVNSNNKEPTDQPILPRFIFGFVVARSPGTGQSRHIQKNIENRVASINRKNSENTARKQAEKCEI